MKNKPLVSVIIPVFNCEMYLAEAIESVLAQTYQPVELIVINDGSTDSSDQVAKGYGSVIRYYEQENVGTGVTLNRGITLAEGRFFAFLDADDLWVKNKTALQMDVFNQEPDSGIVLGHVQQFHSPELDDKVKKRIYCPEYPMKGYLKSTKLVSRDVFEKVGEFSTHFRTGDFIDWYARVRELDIKRIMIPDVVSKRRLHTSNTGARDPLSQLDYARVIRSTLMRRRNQATQKCIKTGNS